MIYRLKSLFVPAALALGLVACGGGGGSLSASDAIDQSFSEGCAKYFECMDSYPGDFEATFGATEAACVDNLKDLTGSAELLASVEAGRITYNSSDAEACLDGSDLSGVSCDDLWAGNVPDGPPECDTAFVGAVEDGGECTIDDDCATDGATCDGTCFPPA